MVILDEKLASLIERDWKVSEKDIKRARAGLVNFFKVMNSPETEEIRGEPFTPNDEKMWAIKNAASRKIYLTVMWFRAREIIAAIIVAAIVFFWVLPLEAIAAILFAVLFGSPAYILSRLMRPAWCNRLYHDRGMYGQSVLADAFYGEIEPLSIGEMGIRPKPAWITRFIA